jgi:hypothetical protein
MPFPNCEACRNSKVPLAPFTIGIAGAETYRVMMCDECSAGIRSIIVRRRAAPPTPARGVPRMTTEEYLRLRDGDGS